MTTLTIIFLVFTIVFLVLFCVSNQVATKEAAELKRYKLIAEREKQNHCTAFAKCQSVIEEKKEDVAGRIERAYRPYKETITTRQ